MSFHVRFFESFKDKAGVVRTVTSAGDEKFERPCWVTFSIRDLLRTYEFDVKTDPIIIDLMTVFDHAGEISSLLRKQGIESDFSKCEERVLAAFKAMKTTGVDDTTIPLDQYIPFIDEFMNEKMIAAKKLFEKITPEMLEHYIKNVWPLLVSLLEIEKNRIKIDREFVRTNLKRMDLASHERKMLQGTLDTLSDDSFVRQRINPNGTKTHRLGNLRGFQAMAIPHGVCRQAVISRFEGGKIASIDFNAIDYRSIVKAVNDPRLSEMYRDADDFHMVTATFLDSEIAGDIRDGVKKLTYVLIYGGSQETMRAIELPKEKIDSYRERLEVLFEPISKFRERLSIEARSNGFVVTPSGLKVPVEKNDHDGKIMGLYAQTFSSSVFNSVLAPIIAMTKRGHTKLIFTVHDEFNFDVHPDELDVVVEISEMIEKRTGFKVSVSLGENYAEATD